MLEVEMDDHLGYVPYERSENQNSRNGYKRKQIGSKYGEATINVPQDRESSISMYAKGMTTSQISQTIEDIYGFEVSEGMK